MPEDNMDGSLGRKVKALREYYTPSFPDSFEGLCGVMDEVGMIDHALDPDSGMITMKTLRGNEILGELMSPDRGIIAIGAYTTMNSVLLDGVMNTYMTYRSDEDRDRIFGKGRIQVENPRTGKAEWMDKDRIFAYDQKAEPVPETFELPAQKKQKHAVAMMALPNVRVNTIEGGIEMTDTRLLDANMKEMELVYSRLDGDSRLVRNMAMNQRIAFQINRELEGASVDTQKAVYRVLAEMAPHVPGRGLMDVLAYRDKMRAEGKDDDIIADMMARKLASDPSFRGRSGQEVISYARKLLSDANNAERKQLIDCLNMANEAAGGKPYIPSAKVLKRIADELSGRNGVMSFVDTPEKAMGLYALAALSPEMLPETLDAIENEAFGWNGFNVMLGTISTAAKGYFDPSVEYSGDLKEARETIREDFFDGYLQEAVKAAYKKRMISLKEMAEARENAEYANDIFGDELEELYDRMEQWSRIREMNEMAKGAPESAGMAGPSEDIRECVQGLAEEYASSPEFRIYRVAADVPVTADMIADAQKKVMSDFYKKREEKMAELREKGGMYNRLKALLMEHTTVLIEPTEKQMAPYIMRKKLEMARRRGSGLGNVDIDALMGGSRGTNYLA